MATLAKTKIGNVFLKKDLHFKIVGGAIWYEKCACVNDDGYTEVSWTPRRSGDSYLHIIQIIDREAGNNPFEIINL